MRKLFWLDSILVWREPRNRARAERIATPWVQRFKRRFGKALVAGTAFGVLMSLVYIPTNEFLERLDVVLFACVLFTLLVFHLDWFNGLFPDYIRITADAVHREPMNTSKPQKWGFDQISSFALVSDVMHDIPYRLLRLKLRDGRNLDIEIGGKVSDDAIREAFHERISEVVMSSEEPNHGRSA